ncbi:paraneoplastic antigen Ma1 homolog [Haliotis rubra]|uniref:paraneoplastic antigen Ma1 homolog n=1 Tax=Haliotis rubra TaxID=36100 RepID=UPI001EE6177F|nr:paraneoplastic antigen Ma1 homolog [Haliotis rubra]
MTSYTQAKVEAEDEPQGAVSSGKFQKQSPSGFPSPVTLTQAPRLPSFSGEQKGETSFEVWKYQVECLLQNKSLSQQVVANTVQHSLRGKAATIAMCLGPEADLKQLISKLESIFGSVDRNQSLLACFYGARQGESEDVAVWDCRLEHLLNQAATQGSIPLETRSEMLRTQLWSGSKPDLRDLTAHVFDQGNSYEDLLRALRRAEADLQQRGARTGKKGATPNMAAVAVQGSRDEGDQGDLETVNN